MLNEEVARYRELSGDTTPNVPISRIGGYLDGYEKALEQEPKLEPCWETCFDCPLSHGCPKIKGCTNEQAIEYASKIPNDCPLFAQPERKPCEDAISRQAVTQPKLGHWIFDEILDKHYYCSECKSMGVDYWDYCPYCGAKMIEPQAESEERNDRAGKTRTFCISERGCR